MKTKLLLLPVVLQAVFLLSGLPGQALAQETPPAAHPDTAQLLREALFEEQGVRDLEKAAADEHGRVRLEAIVAASWLPDSTAAKKIVAVGSSQPLDRWSKDVAKTAANRLAGVTNGLGQRTTYAYDPAGNLAKTWKVADMPTSLVFDRKGTMRFRHQGFFPGKAAEYEGHIAQLVREK